MNTKTTSAASCGANLAGPGEVAEVIKHHVDIMLDQLPDMDGVFGMVFRESRQRKELERHLRKLRDRATEMEVGGAEPTGPADESALTGVAVVRDEGAGTDFLENVQFLADHFTDAAELDGHDVTYHHVQRISSEYGREAAMTAVRAAKTHLAHKQTMDVRLAAERLRMAAYDVSSVENGLDNEIPF